MASIHKKRLANGDIVWELTHGTGRDRQRFIAGNTRAEALIVLKQLDDHLRLHGYIPHTISVADATDRYLTFLQTNRAVRSVSGDQRSPGPPNWTGDAERSAGRLPESS